MIRNYITVAIRNLLRYKGYSAINILGLSLGLATCIVIVRYVQDEFSVDGWHDKGDRIYRVIREARTGGEKDIGPGTSGALSGALKEFPEVEEAIRMWLWFTDVPKGDTKLRLRVCATDPETFKMFNFPFVKGSLETAFPNPNSIAITESAARRLFGDEDPVGKIIEVQSNHHGGERTITSVLKDLPNNTTIRFDYVASTVFSEQAKQVWSEWLPTGGFRPVNTYFLLREGATIESVASKVQGIIDRHFPTEVAKTNSYHLQPFNHIYLYSKADYGFDWYGDIDRVYQFAAIAFLVLAIGCINFTNLATARSAGRAKEVGLRKVSGAVRGQLLGQFLGESIVTAFIALVVGLVIVLLALDSFNAFFNKQLDIDMIQDPLLGIALLVVAVVVGCAAGLYPALYLSSFEPTETLKGTFRSGTRGQMIRKGLVILQFAISVVLIIGTGVIAQQMEYIRNKDLGYNMEQIVIVPLFWTDQESKSVGNRLADRYVAIKQAFLNHPNVIEATAYRWWLGWGGGITRNVKVEGHEDTDFRMPVLEVDDDYLDVFQIELLKGRNFDLDTFPSDTSGVFIVNESAVKSFGWDDPIGKQFTWIDREISGTVIGVVKDFNYGPLTDRVAPASLTVNTRQFYNLGVRVKAEGFEETTAHFKRLWGEFVDKTFPYEHTLWDEQFEQMYFAERRVQSLTLLGSGTAILLACMGLFGLASFAMAERRKEIGVRKSVGASVPGILVLVSKEFMVMVGIASLIAAPLAWWMMDGWLNRFAYRMELGIGVFVMGALLTMAVAQVTVLYHALGAARTDPVKALRYE
jgi:putative ABC transport system permease protein